MSLRINKTLSNFINEDLNEFKSLKMSDCYDKTNKKLFQLDQPRHKYVEHKRVSTLDKCFNSESFDLKVKINHLNRV